MKSGRFGEFVDRENSSGHGGDSAPNSAGDHKLATYSSSPKKSRKASQNKVVSIPFKDLESLSRNKGEVAPPSDSWAWRKYGQKPIKGSPYPRGYYRCSSSKGCPARKHVERSRADPTVLVVTYSSDHNHPWPPSSRNNHGKSPSNRHSPPPARTVNAADTNQNITNGDETKFSALNVAATDGFHGWFADTGFGTMIESPMLAETSSNDTDVSMLFQVMGEEEEYLFADLGELPECSVKFRQWEVVAAAGVTQWCRTTS